MSQCRDFFNAGRIAARRRTLAMALLVLSLIALPAQAQHQSRQTISVQFHWLAQFEFAGFFAAKEQGFYDEVGLDVQFPAFKLGETDVTESVLSGDAEYGVNYSSLLADFHQGKPLVVLASLLQESPLVLMTRDEAGLQSPRDLRGKRIMIGGSALDSAPISALLFGNGITRNDIVVQRESHQIEDLVEGRTDAMTAYSTNEPFQMRQKGFAYRLFDPKEWGLSFYENFLFTSEREVRDHPERVSAFLEATVRGWLYAFNHIEETAQLIHQSYNPQGKSLDALLFEAHELKKLALVGDMPFGVIDLHKLERMEDALRLMGVNISRRPTEDFLWEEIRHGRTTLLTFTPTEKAFIEKTLVRAATTTNWAPIAFIDKGDVAPQGIGYDFWRLVVEKSGLTYKIQPFNRFSDELNAIREKTQDLIYSVGMSESLEKYALFTKPYASFPLVIATAKEEQFLPDATHLIGRKVAVGRNFTAARMMKATFPRIDYMEVTNVAQGLQAVSSGEAYAFVDIMPVVVHAINELGFLNLKISGDTGLTFDLRFMIRDDYPELVSIADKAIESIQPEVRRDILRRWINVQYQHGFDITAYIPYVAGISVVVMIVLGWMYQSKLQAQRANRAKSEFLAVMSHDLRTPLNAIMGFSDMMRHEMLGPLNNEQYITYAHDIHRSGKLLVSLINDILDLSKIEAGKYELDDHPLVIADLIQACCRQCSVMAKTSDITVQEIIETPMPRLRGDERVLIQVLNNLLSNAIKYSDPSSTVTISASVKADNRIELAVADQGHGMTPEEVHRALQPFEQANSAIARRHDGTGLGLHLCQSFMGLFKGGLRVDSAKGRGTTVTLTFPSQRTLL